MDTVSLGYESSGSEIKGLAVNPTNNRIYVVGYYGDTVSVIQDLPQPAAVGGISEYPDLWPSARTGANGSSAPNGFTLGGLATGGALLLAAGGWYTVRRRRAG